GGVAPLAPTRLRHDAEGAVLLASLHHGHEGLEAPGARRARRDLDERTLARLEHGAALAPDPVDQLGHAGDGGRAEDKVDRRRPALDGAPVKLRHAAHHADDEIRPARLEQAQLTELREDLVLGLLSDRAG